MFWFLALKTVFQKLRKNNKCNLGVLKERDNFQKSTTTHFSAMSVWTSQTTDNEEHNSLKSHLKCIEAEYKKGILNSNRLGMFETSPDLISSPYCNQ